MNEVMIDQYKIEISNTDKIFFPQDGITKGDLIKYYQEAAGIMLPHVKERPITMQRMPDGIEGECFYEKHAPDYFPSWVERVPGETEADERIYYITIDNAATLVYLAEEACITPHIWLSRADRLDYPDKMVFDINPSDSDFTHVRSAASYIRGILEDELGLTTFVMTTGSRGLHVVVPLDRGTDFDDVRAFAQDTAAILVHRYPEEFTTEQRKEDKGGRIYIDTARNSFGQTSVAPYAVRGLPGAPVAVPLDWNELADINLSAQKFNLRNIFTRLEEKGDIWKLFWNQICALDEAQERLDSLYSEIASDEDTVGFAG